MTPRYEVMCTTFQKIARTFNGPVGTIRGKFIYNGGESLCDQFFACPCVVCIMGVNYIFFGVICFLLLAFASCHNSSEKSPTEDPRLLNLKHRRYKSLHNITASSSERLESHQSDPHVVYEHHDDHHEDPHVKSSRGGLSLQKAPPDLQFGLAFTVPFVSLSTEKLLNTVSGKNFDSVSSLLKLNFSGLLLAAVVGLLAAAGIFLPGLLSQGGLQQPWLDNIIPHFTDHQSHQYNDYENGWGKPGWGKEFGKDYNGRRSRKIQDQISSIGVGVFKMIDKLRSGVGNFEKCVVERVCSEKESGGGRVTSLISKLDGDAFKDVGVLRVARKVIDGDNSVCGKISGFCEGFKDFEDVFDDFLSGWGEKSSSTEKSTI